MDSEEIYKQAILFRRWLHRHPEVSTQEFQTQAFVIDVLKEYKIPYKTYGTGIIATLGEGADCVALRADMDALRVQEDTGLPYCSETPRADARIVDMICILLCYWGRLLF